MLRAHWPAVPPRSHPARLASEVARSSLAAQVGRDLLGGGDLGLQTSVDSLPVAPRCRRGESCSPLSCPGEGVAGLSRGRLHALRCGLGVLGGEGQCRVRPGGPARQEVSARPAFLPLAWFQERLSKWDPARGSGMVQERDRRAVRPRSRLKSPARERALNSSGPSGEGRGDRPGAWAPCGSAGMTPGQQQGGCSKRAFLLSSGRNVGQASAGQKEGPLAVPPLPATVPPAASLSAPGTEPLCPPGSVGAGETAGAAAATLRRVQGRLWEAG